MTPELKMALALEFINNQASESKLELLLSAIVHSAKKYYIAECKQKEE